MRHDHALMLQFDYTGCAGYLPSHFQQVAHGFGTGDDPLALRIQKSLHLGSPRFVQNRRDASARNSRPLSPRTISTCFPRNASISRASTSACESARSAPWGLWITVLSEVTPCRASALRLPSPTTASATSAGQEGNTAKAASIAFGLTKAAIA